MTKPNYWHDNAIQFPRLLAEMAATGGSLNDLEPLCESMDLEADDLHELVERAVLIWDERKQRMHRGELLPYQHDARETLDSHTHVQGWNRNSQIELLLQFIDQQGLASLLNAYLGEQADTENDYSVEQLEEDEEDEDDDVDEAFCPRCGKDTPRQYGGHPHERDSSNEWSVCLTCQLRFDGWGKPYPGQ
jgi:hypothetical protein